MKSLFSRAALISSLLFSSHTMAAEYLIDTQGAHASINFEVPHLGYSFIAGRFNQFEGSLILTPTKSVTAALPSQYKPKVWTLLMPNVISIFVALILLMPANIPPRPLSARK